MEELAQIGAVTQQAAEGPQSSSKSQQAVQDARSQITTYSSPLTFLSELH